MKIGVVSDTHRNRDNLTAAVSWMTKRHKIGVLYHLGDDSGDVVDIADRYLEVVQVPGIYEAGYLDGSAAAKRIESVMGLTILLVHSLEKDVREDDRARSHIILHGHTHKPEMRLADGLFFMNPGHLKGPMDKNTPPSFGVLDVQDKKVVAEIFNLSFELIQGMTLERSPAGLFRIS